ncbi:MAG: DUF2085 domain-containing protein [Chlorobi bacterium]|nr:DUF2085 domain-containing protein [Chlorobiota bacterium]
MSGKLKFLLSFLIFLWIAGFMIEFVIPYFGFGAFLFPFLKNFYGNVCHQQPEKTIAISSHSMLVCARCGGIYFGAFLSSLIILVAKFQKSLPTKYFFIAGVPMLADVLLYSFGVYSYSKTVAFLTGLLLGSAAFLYFYDALLILFREKEKKEVK